MRLIFPTLLLNCLLPLNFVFCQNHYIIQGQYKFKGITIDEGLSNNHVSSISQDSLGYIWMATGYGIDKFDGYKVTNYSYDNQDKMTISSNDTRVVYTDSKNNTWVGNEGGLDLYNIDDDHFIRFSEDSLHFAIGIIDDIVEDKEGKLWIASTQGLFIYNLSNQDFYAHRSGNSLIDSLLSGHIFRVYADRKNNLWISCFMKGVCVYNQSEDTYSWYPFDPDDKNALNDNRVERFFEDNNGAIWIGTYNNGLNLFDPKDKKFIHMVPDADNPYSTRVRAFFKDPEGNLFIGTRGGLYLFDPALKSFIHYAHSEHPVSKLSQNSILCSFIDKTGSLWLGTFAGGVNYTDLFSKKFLNFTANGKGEYFLSGSDVFAIAEDKYNNLWIGTGDGLNYFNRSLSTFQYIFHDPANPASLGYNDIKALALDNGGNLWVGTNNGGLNKLNMHTRKVKRYIHDTGVGNSISCNKVYGLLCDTDDNLWILSNNEIDNQHSFIDVLNLKNETFTHVEGGAYFGIMQTNNGDICIGGIHGFWKYAKTINKLIFIPDSNHIGRVYTLFEDSRGILWVGSDKGLAGYRKPGSPAYYFSGQMGNPMGIVYGILEDNDKNLWVSSNLGLVRISNIDKINDNAMFQVFDRKDGLQSKQFNSNAYQKLSSGELAFGGINGFNLFDPGRIKPNTIPPRIILNNLKINNQTVSIGEKVNGRVILNKSIQVTGKITLTRKEDIFSLEFLGLHYAAPEQHTYKYILEGFDKTWQITDALNRTVSYNHLPGGRYKFIVYAANRDGIWSADPASLEIIIVPSFKETILFKLLLVFVLLACLFAYYYIKMRNIKKQKNRLEQMVDIKTKEVTEKNEMLMDQADYLSETNTLVEERQMQIEEQAEELKVQKEQLEDTNDKLSRLNATKDKFFSIIAHDLKNPFLTILGFTELLDGRYNMLTDEKRKKYISAINVSANNTYELLENLLSWSRAQTNSIKYHPDYFSLCEIVQESCNLIITHANKKGVEIKNLISSDIEVYIDRNMISTVIRNLISNAVKFTKSGGEVTISLTEKESRAEICIEDTGTGINEERIRSLFMVEKSLSKQGTDGELGTGLGLIICKEFVEKNKGEIWVESEVNVGSKFYFTLPLTPITRLLS